MALFDGRVKVGTRISLEGDDFAPNMGALVGSSFKEDVLNHGTLNQVVQGNVTRMFLANETISLTGNQTVTIMGNQNFTLMGNMTLTIMGTCTKSITGMLSETLVAGQNTLCIGPYNRTDIAPCTWLCPSSSQLNSGSWMESKLHKISCVPVRLNVLGFDTTLRQTNIDVTISKVQTESLCTKIKNLENKAIAGLKNTTAAVCIATAMARSDIKGIHPEVRGVQASVGIETQAPPTTMPGCINIK